MAPTIKERLSQYIMKEGRQIQEQLVSEKTKKLLSIAIGVSVIGLGGQLIYQRFIFPRIYPLQYAYQKLRYIIEKAQSKQKSIIPLSIIKRIKIAQNGLVFNFSVLKDLEKKPVGSSRGQTSNPFLPPFEDGLFVKNLSNTHSLLFNKFAVVKNHMLVITNKFENQDSLLNANDFSAAQMVLLSLKGFWFFNSGPNAGASQQHKHIQVMPHEARQDTPVLNVLSKRVQKLQGQAEDIAYIPFEFRHIIKVLKPMSDEQTIEEYGAYLYNCYVDCMNKLTNLTTDEDGIPCIVNAYNMIVTDNFMLIVLRKQEKTESSPDIAINGMGFTGSFLLKSYQEIKKDQQISPFKLLEEVCFSNSTSPISLLGTPIEGFSDILKVELYLPNQPLEQNP